MKSFQQIKRKREDNRGVLLHTNLSQRLQVTELNGHRFGCKLMSCIAESLRSGEFGC